MLPLSARSLKSIAHIGAVTFAGAAKLPATGPRGFITVNATHMVTPLAGLKDVLNGLGSRATVTFNDGKDLATVKRLAATSDVAIVMAGDISLEGEDRPNLSHCRCSMASTKMPSSQPWPRPTRARSLCLRTAVP